MQFKKLCYLIILSLFYIYDSFSFESKNHRQWLGVFSKKSFAENSSFWHEFQWRYNADQGKTQQTLFRFGLLRNLSKEHEIGMILGLIETGALQEIRPTFQHLYMGQFNDQNVYSIRSRLEYRDLENNSEQSMRYRIQPLLRHLITSEYSLLVFNELFLNFTHETWTGGRLVERNRAFGGLRMDKSYGRWEIGYLNQYVPRKNGSQQEHVLVVYFFF